jgi:aldehyde dehydrogenase (NAD(P)+)
LRIFVVLQDGREARKASNAPVLPIPMTSELGNVTPVLICPGLWTDEEIESKVINIVDTIAFNAGCNCLAPKVVVLPAEWHLVRWPHTLQCF